MHGVIAAGQGNKMDNQDGRSFTEMGLEVRVHGALFFCFVGSQSEGRGARCMILGVREGLLLGTMRIWWCYIVRDIPVFLTSTSSKAPHG